MWLFDCLNKAPGSNPIKMKNFLARSWRSPARWRSLGHQSNHHQPLFYLHKARPSLIKALSWVSWLTGHESKATKIMRNSSEGNYTVFATHIVSSCRSYLSLRNLHAINETETWKISMLWECSWAFYHLKQKSTQQHVFQIGGFLRPHPTCPPSASKKLVHQE